MPSIGLVIPEITDEMLEFCENKNNFAQYNQSPCGKCNIICDDKSS